MAGRWLLFLVMLKSAMVQQGSSFQLGCPTCPPCRASLFTCPSIFLKHRIARSVVFCIPDGKETENNVGEDPEVRSKKFNAFLVKLNDPHRILRAFVEEDEESGGNISVINYITILRGILSACKANNRQVHLLTDKATLRIVRTLLTLLEEEPSKFDLRSYTSLAWCGTRAQQLLGQQKNTEGKPYGDIVNHVFQRFLDLRVDDIDIEAVARLAWCASKSSLPKKVKMEVMQQVSVRLQNIQGEVLSPLDISNIAWSFGNVGYQDVDCMRVLSNMTLTCGLKNFSAQSLSNLLWAIAKIQYKDTILASSVREEVVARGLENFKSQEISNLVWAMVIIQGGLDDSVCNLLEDWSRHSSFKNPQELSIVLWAIAKSWKRLSCSCSNLFDKAKKGLLHPSSQLSRYSPQSISNIVWALAKCNEINDDILQMFSDHVMKVGLSSFKVKDVCLLIHGYSNSNVGYELFEALVPWLQQIGLQQLTEDQITSFSWVLANRLRVRQVPNTGTKQLSQNSRYSHSSLDPLDESFGQHKEDIAELQLMMLIRTWVLSNPLKGFRSKDLSLLVWSFAVSFPMEKLILFPVNECLRSQDISTFSTLSLVNIAWAYAHILKGRDEYFVDTMKGISQEIERRGVHNIPSHQLSSFAWSCCKLGLRDERLFQDIACLLDAGFLQKLTNHSLISLLWALGITDVMKHIQLTIFEQEILKRQVRSFNAIELNTAALAFSRTRYQGRIWEELDAEAIRRSRGKKGK